MCMMPKMPKIEQSPAARLIAAPDSAGATREATVQQRLRRARAGATANVLTSATGIPSTMTLGGAAR